MLGCKQYVHRIEKLSIISYETYLPISRPCCTSIPTWHSWSEINWIRTRWSFETSGWGSICSSRLVIDPSDSYFASSVNDFFGVTAPSGLSPHYVGSNNTNDNTDDAIEPEGYISFVHIYRVIVVIMSLFKRIITNTPSLFPTGARHYEWKLLKERVTIACC